MRDTLVKGLPWERFEDRTEEVRAVIARLRSDPKLAAKMDQVRAGMKQTEAPSPRAAVLDEAKRLIDGERNVAYGPPSQDFARTAAIWTQLFGRPFAAHEVAMAMIVLKLSRMTWQPEHRDNWVDCAGYSGCGWECVENE